MYAPGVTSLPSSRACVWALAVAVLVGAVLLVPVPLALGAMRAQLPPGVHQAKCKLKGPRWTVYDAHGGANPKQVGAGTLYRVDVAVFDTPGNYSCAWANAAVRKIFPENMKLKPNHGTVVLRRGPAGFVCKSAPSAPPAIGAGGRCTRTTKRLKGVFLTWQPVGAPQ